MLKKKLKCTGKMKVFIRLHLSWLAGNRRVIEESNKAEVGSYYSEAAETKEKRDVCFHHSNCLELRSAPVIPQKRGCSWRSCRKDWWNGSEEQNVSRWLRCCRRP